MPERKIIVGEFFPHSVAMPKPGALEFGHRNPKTSSGGVCEEGRENVTNLSAWLPSIKMSLVMGKWGN